MENIDLAQKVSSGSLFIMILSMVVVVFTCIFLYYYIKNAFPEGHQGLFAGMAAYFLICNVILNLVYLAEAFIAAQFQNASLSEGLMKASSNAGTVISLIIQCFIIIYCVEFAYRRFVYQPGISKFGDGLMFGLGFALVETLEFVINTFMNWFMGFNINGVGLEALKEQIGDGEWENYYNSVSFLFTNKPDYYIAALLERFVYLAFIFAVIAMIHFVVAGKLKRTLLVWITVMYFCYFIPNIVNKLGGVKNVWIIILLCLAIVGNIAAIAWKVIEKVSPEDIERIKKTFQEGVFVVAFRRKNKKVQNSNIRKFTRSGEKKQ